MKHNVKAPNVGESITEVSILKWAKQDGEAVRSGEILVEIESDKATIEVAAEASGALTVLKKAGERIPVGELIAVIDDAVQGRVAAAKPAQQAAPSQPAVSQQAQASTAGGFQPRDLSRATIEAAPSLAGPAARKAQAEGRVSQLKMVGTPPPREPSPGASMASATGAAAAPVIAPSYVERPGDRRVPMTLLRSRIAERLVQAQQTAAILTTFNEVDMSAVMELRNRYKDDFKARHGVPLSFMSFFARASVEMLKQIPGVNASIDGRDIIYHDYHDIGIAVGTERGLVVPVLRDAGSLDFVGIEKKIGELAIKAREGKLSIADMSGGTFTISNGGVYGSLLSTPILNPPQSGILGMHKIQERPVAVGGRVEIRPMMYLALSYDHRLIDGKEAVTFLVGLKDLIEHPDKLGFQY